MMLSCPMLLVDRQALSEHTTTSSSTKSLGQALRVSLVKPGAYLSESYAETYSRCKVADQFLRSTPRLPRHGRPRAFYVLDRRHMICIAMQAARGYHVVLDRSTRLRRREDGRAATSG